MIFSGPIIITCGIIYILWVFSPFALCGILTFLVFYPCQVSDFFLIYGSQEIIFYIFKILSCNVIFQQYLISRLVGHFRTKTVVITDIRVKLMNEILECVKLIKMYSWEKYFSNKLLGMITIFLNELL